MIPIYLQNRPRALTDSECYPNYWSISFKSIDDGRYKLFEFFDGHPLDRAGIAKILRNWCIVGFNLIKYDLIMLAAAMQPDATNRSLKALNDEIIIGGLTPWKAEERYGHSLPSFVDFIDLLEVHPGAPQKPSLKLLGGRLHSKRMQELPFEVERWISEADRGVMRGYLRNDIETTGDLHTELKPQIDLRIQMSQQYGLDLRSKSDPQIAEAVIKHEVERELGQRVYRPDLRPYSFRYRMPDFIEYTTDQLLEVKSLIEGLDFDVDPNGDDAADGKKKRLVGLPKVISERKIVIGGTAYQMGIGGLHSTEESVFYRSDDYWIIDRDVTGYYPSIIINQRLFPKHLGPAFLKVYESIRDRRTAAKRAGDKVVAESLKIVGNSSFGKFGSKYSALCSPELMIQTTITGQLSILMLIERLESHGLHVVSANTDGLVTLVPKDRIGLFNAIVFDWECDTGFGTEETRYLALYSRDVNNYLAVKAKQANDGTWLDEVAGVKTKGAFAPSGPGQAAAAGCKKNPAAQITADAAVQFLAYGVPIETTINECQDIRKFVVVRRVTGGAEKNGEYIGKVLRWYYSTEIKGPLVSVTRKSNVPRTEGAKVMLELPEGNVCPDDLDRAFYVREAYAILQDVGLGAVDPALRGRSGVFFGKRPSQKNLHIVNAETGVALCGAERASVREKWEEFDAVPDGHRLCSKCRKEWEL